MSRLDLPANPASPAAARAFVRDLLTDWQVHREVREDAELLVTELVTNALIHAGASATLEVRREGTILHFSVSDDGPGTVKLRIPARDAVTGRGLYILDQLAPDWTVEPFAPRGKTIRFSLDDTSPEEMAV